MGKQLWLDDAGASPVEQADFEEHDIQMPLELQLDEDVDGDAQIVWCVMRGVGKRAQASVEEYAKRLSSKKTKWTLARVKAAQKSLVDAKWIVLLKEGHGGRKGELGLPRLWWICRKKGEAAPLGAFNSEVFSGGAPHSSETLAHPSPKQGLSRDLSLSKDLAPSGAAVPRGTKVEPKKPAYATSDGFNSQQLVERWTLAWCVWKIGLRGVQVAKAAALESLTPIEKLDLGLHLNKGARAIHAIGKKPGFTMDEFGARCDNMGQHQFNPGQDCSLTFFCSHYPEFANGHKQLKGFKGSRYSSQPAESRAEGED